MAITGDSAPNVAGSVIMLTVLAFVSYGLRVYCRVTRRSWSAEDWIMTAALVCHSEAIASSLLTGSRHHFVLLWQGALEAHSTVSAFILGDCRNLKTNSTRLLDRRYHHCQ